MIAKNKSVLPEYFCEKAKEFEQMLCNIGFKITRSHNGLNHFIKNPKGKKLHWRITPDKLEFNDAALIFGKLGRQDYSSHGNIYIRLDKCILEYSVDDPEQAFWIRSGDGISIHFHNFK